MIGNKITQASKQPRTAQSQLGSATNAAARNKGDFQRVMARKQQLRKEPSVKPTPPSKTEVAKSQNAPADARPKELQGRVREQKRDDSKVKRQEGQGRNAPTEDTRRSSTRAETERESELRSQEQGSAEEVRNEEEEKRCESEACDNPEAALALLQSAGNGLDTAATENSTRAQTSGQQLADIEALHMATALEETSADAQPGVELDRRTTDLVEMLHTLAAKTEQEATGATKSFQSAVAELSQQSQDPTVSDEPSLDEWLAEQTADTSEAAVQDLSMGSFVERIESPTPLAANLKKFDWNQAASSEFSQASSSIEMSTEQASTSELRQTAVTKAVNHLTLRHAIRDARTVAHIPNLGKVSIHATNLMGELNIDVVAGAEAAAVIQSASAQLEQHLQNKSIDLVNVDIHEDNSAESDFAFSQEQQNSQQTNHNQDGSRGNANTSSIGHMRNNNTQPSGIVL